MRGLLLTPLIVLVLAACAPADATGGGRLPEPAPAAEPVPTPGPQLYETTAVVLESPDHGPELCLGGVATSYPPQCGGIPITNWDWDSISGWETAAGTTWGTFHVVGTYDGTSFTVTETGPPRPDEPLDIDLGSACPEPDGGWPVPDPERASIQHVERVRAVAAAAPDDAGLWVTYLQEPGEWPEEILLNVAVTGDPAEHEAELRAAWGGPLCLVRFERTLRELQRIQEDLQAGTEAAGLKILGSSIAESENFVYVFVVAADAKSQAEIDRRFGQGAVRITAMLTPLAQPDG